MKRRRKNQEGGFALLLVFLMAAAVAFTIYQELPRAAFESARDKEQLLLDRGNQYKRAIEVFFAVNKRYPAELKDLESFSEKRYLRHRYKDPLTGEDEWRIIHTNGSFLTDSLVQKPPQQNAANGGPGTPGAPTVGAGALGANSMNTAAPAPTVTPGTDPNNPGVPAVNAAVQRRPSDRTITAEGFPQPGNPGAVGGGNPQAGGIFGSGTGNYDPNDPRTWPAITLAPANPAPGQGAPGQVNSGQYNPGQYNPGQPGQPPNTQVAAGQLVGSPGGINQGGTGQGFPPQGFPNPQGQFNQPGQQFNQPQSQFNQPQQQFNRPQQQFNSGTGSPFPPTSFPAQAGVQASPQIGVPGAPQPVNTGATVGGLTPGNGGNPALQAINDQLFRPGQTAGPGGPGGAMGSPGIAGVASKHEGPSIKSYRERTKYQEWEFVFDGSARTGPQGAVPGQNPAGQGPLGANPLGQTPLGQSPAGQNPFGQPGIGQPPGQQPFGQPGIGQQPLGQPAPGQNPSNPFPPGFSNPFSPQGQNQGR